MPKFFYNTIDESEKDLEGSKSHAKMQEEVIFLLFISNPELEATPFEVLESLNLKNTPITSIRRAMTNLTEKGKLIKTGTKKMEKYGKANYCWRLNRFATLDSVGGEKKLKKKKFKRPEKKKVVTNQQALF